MGEKFFEIRSKRPLHFDEKKDVVFVVQKGSKRVPLYFTITRFFNYDSSSDKAYLAEKAAVSVEYIDNYIKGKKCICAWEIGYACKIFNQGYLYYDLKINKNPQSFVYRDFEWRKVHFKNYVWLSRPKNSFDYLEPFLEYERYYGLFSSAKPSTL